MTTATDLTLVPRPQRIEFLGDGPALSTPITEQQVEDLPAQGFQLTITATDITLGYADEAGLRYGRGLLHQIRRQSTDNWPALRVTDWPDFGVRGYMLDISRGRVPTRETLSRIVDLLELLRVNHLQLYTEHTFAYAGHEIVWRDASPMTADDIHWLDTLCRKAGIELVANQNTFGHMEHWLSHDRYRDRAEMPDGFEMWGGHRPAMTLAPTEDNARFALGLIDELLPHFTSDKVNIGCDETWELGRGASAEAVAAKGKGRVYLEYLNSLLKPLIAAGKDVQFWGDIIAHDPQLVPELAAGATAVAWSYEAPWNAEAAAVLRAAYPGRFDAGDNQGEMLSGFAPMVVPFTDAGYPFWVAPGTSTWTSLIGRLDNAIGNLADTAQVGLAGGASGFLITDWGDRGHLQPPSVSFPPLVYGAAVGWSLEANRNLSPVDFLNRFVFDDPTGKLGAAMDVLGRAWGRTGQTAFNCSPLQAALTEDRYVVAGDADAAALTATLSDLDSAMAEITASQPACADGETVKRELIAAIRLARHGGRRLLANTTGEPMDNAAMAADLSEAIVLHKDAWNRRSRPGGMHRGLDPVEQTLASYS